MRTGTLQYCLDKLSEIRHKVEHEWHRDENENPEEMRNAIAGLFAKTGEMVFAGCLQMTEYAGTLRGYCGAGSCIPRADGACFCGGKW